WEQFPAFAAVYEMIPGFIMGLLSIIIVSLLTTEPSQEILDEFAKSAAETKGN
ncbi:MAG: sodium:proline symporter, partial [Desulfitobacterium hafniense]